MGSHVAPNPWRDHSCAYYFASQRRHHAHANIQMAYSILSKPVNICMRSMSPATCDLVGTTVILGPGCQACFHMCSACTRLRSVLERGLNNAVFMDSWWIRHPPWDSVGRLPFPYGIESPWPDFICAVRDVEGDPGRPKSARKSQQHGDDASRSQWPKSDPNGCCGGNQRDCERYGSLV